MDNRIPLDVYEDISSYLDNYNRTTLSSTCSNIRSTIQESFTYDNIEEFYNACHYGCTLIVAKFIDNGVFDGMGIIDAAEGGHVGIVDMLINAGISPTFQYDAPLYVAVEEGHLDVVARLLDYAGVQPRLGSDLLERAIDSGNSEILKLLLNDDRMDELDRSDILLHAILAANLEVIHTVIDYGRVEPTDHDLYEAVVLGDLSIFNDLLLLLEDRHIGNADRLLSTAIHDGKIGIARSILDYRAKDILWTSLALRDSIATDNLDMVTLLLVDGLFDVDDSVVAYAKRHASREIVELLERLSIE